MLLSQLIYEFHRFGITFFAERNGFFGWFCWILEMAFLFSLGITVLQVVWDVCCILYRKKMTVLMHLLHNVTPFSLLFSCHTTMLLYIFTNFQKRMYGRNLSNLRDGIPIFSLYCSTTTHSSWFLCSLLNKMTVHMHLLYYDKPFLFVVCSLLLCLVFKFV